MNSDQSSQTRPALWVPTLYVAEGLPYFAVSLLAIIFYQRMGVRNDVIAFYTSALLLPWSLKPLWSPLLEMYRTKKFFVVVLEFVGGLSLALMALCLPFPGYFTYTLAFLFLVAFASSTHDIAADGLYISSLSAKDQAAYVGWQGGSYNVARFFAQGGLVILAGVLEKQMPVVRAWMIIFAILGLILIVLSAYHARMLPTGGEERRSESLRQVATTFWDVIVSFFQKPSILLMLVFIFLYRAGEGQLERIKPLFLLDARVAGGLGLTQQQFGVINGIIGTGFFIFGSIVGGYFASRVGLRRALLPCLAALSFRSLVYFYFATATPANLVLVTSALCVEMFGYGFGFVAIIVLMMQEIAPGNYQTAHYAFANSLMNLGLMVPGLVSGKIQIALGYRNFFVWVLAWAIPALALVRFLPLRGGANASRPQQPAEA